MTPILEAPALTSRQLTALRLRALADYIEQHELPVGTWDRVSLQVSNEVPFEQVEDFAAQHGGVFDEWTQDDGVTVSRRAQIAVPVPGGSPALYIVHTTGQVHEVER